MANGCHDATINRDKMKTENREKDRWILANAQPYRAHVLENAEPDGYLGLNKAQFQIGAFAIDCNL